MEEVKEAHELEVETTKLSVEITSQQEKELGSTESLNGNKEHSEDEEDYDSADSVILEREEGDGQESAPGKKVDDDEDKKNPQYIPKRGTFYEHDDRTLDEEEKAEVVEKVEKTTKKNIWMEKKERWNHDRFNDNEQAPKSRSELISIYGYDIRNEDGPPRPRRRRRYGRGPNKYTRNWEDEDAYRALKTAKPVQKPKKGDSEEFPLLVSEEEESNEGEVKKETESTSTSSSNVALSPTNEPTPPKESVVIERSIKYGPSDKGLQRTQPPRVGTGRIIKPKDVKQEVKDSDYKGFTKTRQFRNSKVEQRSSPQGPTKEEKQIFVHNRINRINKQSLEKDMSKLNIQDKGIKQGNSRQGSVPPRLQNEQKGSKRYSSMRQRSLPETAAPPFTQPSTFYPSDYQQSSQSPPMIASTTIHAGGAPVPQITPPPLAGIPPQVPVTATPIAQYPAPFPQAPPTFLPPNVPAPPFIPQQAPPPLINYVQGQPPPPMMPQASFQGFQHQQFNAVQNPPGELYQCQGGTTYYSTQNQHIAQRVVPTKRPKAAIPILPPPPESRGRGRVDKERESPSPEVTMVNSMENLKDYEDAVVIVEQ